MPDAWRHPSAAWWAKAARAQKHIQDVGALVTGLERAAPYQIHREVTDQPGRVAFRFRLLKPMPVHLLTTIGDVLHNLRSCLDSVAFELARRHVGDAMTEKQESAAQFPICRDRGAFDEFVSSPVRRGMYGQQERDALRCVQPFALHDELAALGTDPATSLADEYRINELARLNRLSNLDKHRRLPLLAWYAGFVYLTGDAPGCTWSRPARQPAGLQDNDVIGYLTHQDPGTDHSPALKVEMRLALTEDPGYTNEVVGVLERWHSYLVSWVLPRIFAVADGNPPPIMIASVIPA
jgi:hypothetical protein